MASHPIDSTAASGVQPARPGHALYSQRQIAWSSFLGGPIAGAWQLAVNYRRLGNEDAFWGMLFAGLALELAAGLAALLAPTDFPNRVIPGAYCSILSGLAWALQRRPLATHVRSGGAIASNPRSLAVASSSLVATLALAVAADEWLPVRSWNYVASGENGVYYEGGASRADADALIDRLEAIGLFEEATGVEVTLRRGGRAVELRIPLAGGAWDDPEVVAFFEEIRPELGDALDASRPIEIHLCNDWGSTRRVLR
ncbi:MAG: hypothetical protein R3F35_11895 [Myxococcota bacterium]